MLAATVQTQQVDRPAALRAQIDRIFKERAYAAPRFGPARWLPDGTAYAIVEQPKGGSGSEIARYDAVTGARTVLLDSSRLVPPGQKTPLTIEDYTWSADGKQLLVFTNTQKVWRDNTRGDYWVLDVGSGALRQLWVNQQGSTKRGYERSGVVRPHVREVLARRNPRRLRSGEQYLRRASGHRQR